MFLRAYDLHICLCIFNIYKNILARLCVAVKQVIGSRSSRFFYTGEETSFFLLLGTLKITTGIKTRKFNDYLYGFCLSITLLN